MKFRTLRADEIVPYPDNSVGVNCTLEVEDENEST